MGEIVGVAEELLDQRLVETELLADLLDGFFHADPHPGNVFLTDDHQIALLDLGMVARIAPRMQQHMLQVVLAVSEGRGDETADFALRIGQPTTAFDERMREMLPSTKGLL